MAGLSKDVESKMTQHVTRLFPTGSDIANWYALLSEKKQEHVNLSPWKLINKIKATYLGGAWLQDLKDGYNSMTFRQKGYEKETPFEFMQWCLILARFLDPELKGAREVHQVMEATLPSWGSMLNSTWTDDVAMLMMQVQVQEKALIADFEKSMDHNWDQLKMMMDSQIEKYIRIRNQQRSSLKKGWQEGHAKRVNKCENDRPGRSKDSKKLGMESSSLSKDVRTILNIAKKYNRSKTMKEYPHKPLRDDVVSKGNTPPGPCRYCRSSKHWNQDCPHSVKKKEVHFLEKEKGGQALSREEELYESLETVASQLQSHDVYERGGSEVRIKEILTADWNRREKASRGTCKIKSRAKRKKRKIRLQRTNGKQKGQTESQTWRVRGRTKEKKNRLSSNSAKTVGNKKQTEENRSKQHKATSNPEGQTTPSNQTNLTRKWRKEDMDKLFTQETLPKEDNPGLEYGLSKGALARQRMEFNTPVESPFRTLRAIKIGRDRKGELWYSPSSTTPPDGWESSKEQPTGFFNWDTLQDAKGMYADFKPSCKPQRLESNQLWRAFIPVSCNAEDYLEMDNHWYCYPEDPKGIIPDRQGRYRMTSSLAEAIRTTLAVCREINQWASKKLHREAVSIPKASPSLLEMGTDSDQELWNKLGNYRRIAMAWLAILNMAICYQGIRPKNREMLATVWEKWKHEDSLRGKLWEFRGGIIDPKNPEHRDLAFSRL